MAPGRTDTIRVLALLGLFVAGAALADDIELVQHCPPGFELDDGTCRLHTLYDNYDSLRDTGVGGLRTALPPARDGFTPAQIDLGRYLFFDPLLSANDDLSCGSCHHPELGFSDGSARSHGADGTPLARSAPSLWNVAFQQRLFWDARAASLEEQMKGPLYAADEMASNPADLIAEITANEAYRRLFREAFPGDEASPTLEQLYTAIAAFQSSLVSLNSRYDQYAHGHHAALSDSELEGLNIFRSFVARCAECHTPPLFTNQQIAVIGVAGPDGLPFDEGAGAVFDNPTWRGGFKVPSLRNVALTAPYMHAGTLATLRDAAEFYTLGRGHALPDAEKQRMILHWHIWEPALTDTELDRLVEFLETLTDERFRPSIPVRVPSGLQPVGRVPTALQAVADQEQR